jgi:hypothetical protein
MHFLHINLPPLINLASHLNPHQSPFHDTINPTIKNKEIIKAKAISRRERKSVGKFRIQVDESFANTKGIKS